MKLLPALLIAILTAIAGLFIAAGVASLIVDWYRISSFEGGSGYFVVFTALFAGVASFVAGLIVAFVAAARWKAGFFKALVASCGLVLIVGVGAAAVARLLADIPPEIDGQQLFLSIELRWPDGQAPASELTTQPGVVTLGALNGRTMRVSEDGPLFTDRAVRSEGSLAMPGEVRVFTGRGTRVLMFHVGATEFPAFEVPLPARPDASSRQWSDWLPRAGAPDVDKGFRYRYRVRLADEPLRTEQVGPFAIDVIPHRYYHVSETEAFAAASEFTVSINNSPVAALGRLSAVAALPDGQTLLVSTTDDGVCRAVKAGSTQPPITDIGECGAIDDARPITAEQARFDRARKRETMPGWIDRRTFDQPGLFVLGQFVFDTRTLDVRRFEHPDDFPAWASAPPLSVSPDEQRFVTLATDHTGDELVFVVIDRTTGRGVPLHIDRARMRFNDERDFGPAWIDHHFEWQSTASGMELHERPRFVPLPYRGRVELGKAGEFQSYTLRPGGTPLRDAIVSLLVDAGGQVTDESGGDYKRTVRLEHRSLEVAVLGDHPSYVMVSMNAPDGDPAFMSTLAERLDGILATGRLDQFFVDTKVER